LLRRFRGELHCGEAVIAVRRAADEVHLKMYGGDWRHFDHVVFACHGDQALRILGDEATLAEREILSAFPYQQNSVVLHTDERMLPGNRRAWACWNYHIPKEEAAAATVTYNMNLLQGIRCRKTFLVTLNRDEAIDPAQVLGRFTYHHPVFDLRREAAQRRHGELLRQRRTSFCGAYWRNGFHEDGVVSALAVCRSLKEQPTHVELPVRRHGPAPATAAG
jgi:predicted NAD/FAD-binding protein